MATLQQVLHAVDNHIRLMETLANLVIKRAQSKTYASDTAQLREIKAAYRTKLEVAGLLQRARREFADSIKTNPDFQDEENSERSAWSTPCPPDNGLMRGCKRGCEGEDAESLRTHSAKRRRVDVPEPGSYFRSECAGTGKVSDVDIERGHSRVQHNPSPPENSRSTYPPCYMGTSRTKRTRRSSGESLPIHSAKRRRVDAPTLDSTVGGHLRRTKRESEDPPERLQKYSAKRRRVDAPIHEDPQPTTAADAERPDDHAESSYPDDFAAEVERRVAAARRRRNANMTSKLTDGVKRKRDEDQDADNDLATVPPPKRVLRGTRRSS